LAYEGKSGEMPLILGRFMEREKGGLMGSWGKREERFS